MPKYTEDQVKQAIDQANATKNVKAAAKAWGIPYSTLRHRLEGIGPKYRAQSHRQRLSPAEEEHLASWVMSQRTLGLAPTLGQLREFAQHIAANSGDDRPIGQNWATGFLRRNPKVQTVKCKAIDFNRPEGDLTEQIKDFFERLALPVIKNIPPQYRYNMDETGIMEGKEGNVLLLGMSDDHFEPQKVPESCTWSSILETVSAVGVSLPPFIIYKEKSIQHDWLSENPEEYKDWCFTLSEKGWSSSEIGLEWLKKIFIPLTKPEKPQMRLLIVNGHGCHATTDFMWECYTNDIHVLYFPDHSSHLLHPLDLMVFPELQKAYRKEVQRLVDVTDDLSVGKADILKSYIKARKQAMKPETIRAGWKWTGMWPISMTKSLNNPWFVQQQRQLESNALHKPIAKRKTPDTIENIFTLPRSSHDIHKAVKLIEKTEKLGHEEKLIFQKVGMMLDKYAVEIAERDMKIEMLENKLEDIQRKKRRT